MAKLKTKISKRKTKSRWLINALVLIVALWLVFILTARALRPAALAQIAELTGAEVKAKSVDINLNGSVFIEELVIRPLPVADKARPDRQPKYDDAILKAKTVYARFSITSLLLLRPRLKVIDVNDFVFDARYDLDTGRWNVAALKIKLPKTGSGKMPLVHLENGTLQYSKVSNAQVRAIAAVALDAEFAPDEEMQPGCIFTITTADRTTFGKNTLTGSWRPGRITIAGGISSADVPALERAWKINVLAAELKYDPDNTYSLKLVIQDLLGTHSPAPDTFAQVRPSSLEGSGLFPALQRFFSRFLPAGRIDINLEASGNLQQLTESTLRGNIFCKDVSIIDQKFLYPVQHIAGQVDFTERSFQLKNLTGRHGDTSLVFNGWSEDFGPNWKYQIKITSDNMALDNDLYNALSTKQKEFWVAFSPAGLAAIDYRISRQSQTDKEKTLAVELLDAEATYRNFPYPLKNLTGNLFFDSDSVIVSEVVSQVKGRKITLNGKVTAHATDRPIYDISIKTENIPLDSTLVAALPAEQRHLCSRFNMTGLTDANVKIFTPEQNFGPISFLADVSFKKASLRIPLFQENRKAESLKANQFSLAISDISAEAVFTPDLIRTKDLIANCYNGRLTGKFELKHPPDRAPEYLLQIGFDNIDLKQFLSAAIQNSKSNGHTNGKMNGSLSITGRIGDIHSRTGRCRLQITDMQVGTLSPLSKLLYVLKLTEPDDFAFSRMLVDSYIKDNKVFFQKLDLSGQAIAFTGSGLMDLQNRNLDLILTARGRRLATAEPSILQSLTEGLGQAVVQMKVTGDLYDPQVTTTTLPLITETLGILRTNPAQTE